MSPRIGNATLNSAGQVPQDQLDPRLITGEVTLEQFDPMVGSSLTYDCITAFEKARDSIAAISTGVQLRLRPNTNYYFSRALEFVDRKIDLVGMTRTSTLRCLPGFADLQLIRNWRLSDYSDNASGPQAFTVAATGDLFAANAHGLQNNDAVRLPTLTPGAGLATNTQYFVINRTTNTFQLALTAGGAAIDVTTDGSGTVYLDRTVPPRTIVNPQYYFYLRGIYLDLRNGPAEMRGIQLCHAQETSRIDDITMTNDLATSAVKVGIDFVSNSDATGGTVGALKVGNIVQYGGGSPTTVPVWTNAIRALSGGSDLEIDTLTTSPGAYAGCIIDSSLIDIGIRNFHSESWVDVTASDTELAILRSRGSHGFKVHGGLISLNTANLAHPLVYAYNSHGGGFGVTPPQLIGIEIYNQAGGLSWLSTIPLIKDRSQPVKNPQDIWFDPNTWEIAYYDGNIYSENGTNNGDGGWRNLRGGGSRKGWMPTGAIAETYERSGRATIQQPTGVFTSGTLFLSGGATISAGRLATGIGFVYGSTVSAGISHWWYVLVAASTRTVLAYTADQGAVAPPTNAKKELSFVTNWRANIDTDVYCGFYFDAGTTTQPSFIVTDDHLNNTLTTLPRALVGGSNSGLANSLPTDLAGTLTAPGGGGYHPYAYVLGS